jgi:hypothetical protein
MIYAKVLSCFLIVSKEILILSTKKLIILMSIKNYLLISGIYFTYKFIIPYTKRKQNIFSVFLKYWLSFHVFIKLVIKAEMHAKHVFLNFFCYMKIQYDFFIFERLGWMHEKKYIFFYIMCFCNISKKTGYFNTEFISL